MIIGVLAVLTALFFCSLYLPIYSPSPLTGIEWIFVGGWTLLGLVFFIINKATMKNNTTVEEIEFEMFGEEYKRF